MPDLYFIVEFPIFREFEADDVEALGSVCESLTLPAGAAVCREGDPGDALYIVQSGVLEVSKVVSGRRLALNLVSAGEFFGEMALIDSTPRSADVTVKEDARLVRLPAGAFLRLRKERPATALRVADVLLKTLSFRLRRTNVRALSGEAQALPKGLAERLERQRKRARKAARRRRGMRK